MGKAAEFAREDAKPCSLCFQFNYLKFSRLNITPMPTIFALWKTCKSLVWDGLVR
jgi:hypothetical protein